MCKLKSVIVLKNKVYCPDHDSHQRMLKELRIKDTTENAMRRFARCELSPKAEDNYASDISEWEIKVDQDILPDWWDEDTYRPMVEDAVREWQSKHVITSGEIDVHDGVYYACGSATVRAYGSATVDACGSATVYAHDSATVYAYDSATVIISAYSEVSEGNITLADNAVLFNHRDLKIICAKEYEVENNGNENGRNAK